MMKRIIVLGSNGQLGSELKSLSTNFDKDKFTFLFLDRSTIDLSHSDVEMKIASLKPDFVINCAAYTAVDKAEKEIEACYAVNAYGVAKVAKACKTSGAVLMHISSDYVYHGDYTKPITELMPTLPKGIYALSKRQGEKLALFFNPKSIIIRTSWVYSTYGNNFVKTMLNLAKQRNTLSIVEDQYGAPTYAEDLAKTIIHIIEKVDHPRHFGIYNYANEGITNWKEFAETIFKYTHKNNEVLGISTEQYNAPAPRPKWSVMNLAKIKSEFDLTNIPHWRDSLQKMIASLTQIKH